MDTAAALRRLNVCVRKALLRRPLTLGSIAYFHFMQCGIQAMFDRSAATTPTMAAAGP